MIPASPEKSVLLLRPRGFRAGVARALEIVELALRVHVRKEIAHNRHVVRDLASRGAIFVEEVDEVPQSETVQVPSGGVACLTQTTFSLDETDAIIRALKRRLPGIQAPPTQDTCHASENRQQAVQQIAPRADLLLVVGSETSSDSKRLAEAVRSAGMCSCPIDGEECLSPAWLDGIRHAAVSTGASAPERIAQDVVRHLQACGFRQVQEAEATSVDVNFPIPPKWRQAQPLAGISATV